MDYSVHACMYTNNRSKIQPKYLEQSMKIVENIGENLSEGGAEKDSIGKNQDSINH